MGAPRSAAATESAEAAAAAELAAAQSLRSAWLRLERSRAEATAQELQEALGEAGTAVALHTVHGSKVVIFLRTGREGSYSYIRIDVRALFLSFLSGAASSGDFFDLQGSDTGNVR